MTLLDFLNTHFDDLWWLAMFGIFCWASAVSSTRIRFR